jgi:hypothetical protein
MAEGRVHQWNDLGENTWNYGQGPKVFDFRRRGMLAVFEQMKGHNVVGCMEDKRKVRTLGNGGVSRSAVPELFV